MAIFEIKELKKDFGAVQVLKGVTVDVQAGEVLSIIGSSGSGKSTFLRCLNLLEKPSYGKIIFDNNVVFNAEVKNGEGKPTLSPRQLRIQVGMVFQQFNLWPHYNTLTNVAAPLRFARGVAQKQAEEIAEKMLIKVGLRDKLQSYPSQLSGGQQQRVAIARALVSNPKAILLDEVTSALDPELVGEVLTVLRELAATGMTMIMVTHEMEFAHEISSRVAFMHAGQIAEIGPPHEVMRAPKQARTREFLERFLRTSRK